MNGSPKPPPTLAANPRLDRRVKFDPDGTVSWILGPTSPTIWIDRGSRLKSAVFPA